MAAEETPEIPRHEHSTVHLPEVGQRDPHPIWECCGGPTLCSPVSPMEEVPGQLEGSLPLLWLVSMEVRSAKLPKRLTQMAAPEWALPYLMSQ